MAQRTDPEGRRLPIKLDSTSNGEFVPVPLSAANRRANRLAHEYASGFARKLNLTRRRFLVSACGAASTLLAFNQANAAVGLAGGFFDLPREAALEPELAQAAVGGRGEFIFDVQGHFVDPAGDWVKNASPGAFKWSPKASCSLSGAKRSAPVSMQHLDCLGPEEFVTRGQMAAFLVRALGYTDDGGGDLFVDDLGGDAAAGIGDRLDEDRLGARRDGGLEGGEVVRVGPDDLPAEALEREAELVFHAHR